MRATFSKDFAYLVTWCAIFSWPRVRRLLALKLQLNRAHGQNPAARMLAPRATSWRPPRPALYYIQLIPLRALVRVVSHQLILFPSALTGQ
jgi:hypothetical protein